ncbi:MAG TPA: CBS domain-containing protein [Pirellulales bacterium]|nr:CBS domain-containing protein [Pirellulales bacterium]
MDIELNLTTDSVAEALPAQPVCVAPSASIREVLQLMKERSVGSVLVCQGGAQDQALVGIFTERDALRVMARNMQGGAGELNLPVESVMSSHPASIAGEAKMAAAIQRMSAGGYRRLPIVDAQSHPTGLLQASGIVHYLVQHFPKTIYNQPPVAHPLTQEREGP